MESIIGGVRLEMNVLVTELPGNWGKKRRSGVRAGCRTP